MLTGDGPDHCGTVSVHTLGITGAEPPRGHRLDWPALAMALPAVLTRRLRNVNKGTFGTLGILGGSEGMGGALILAGRAALRTGAGKVWLGFLMAEPPKLDTQMPELMLRHAGVVLDAQPDALVVGPGLGTSDAARARCSRARSRLAIPVALDADALNLIAKDPALRAATRRRSAPTLATPHPGEAARVLGVDIPDSPERIACSPRNRLVAASWRRMRRVEGCGQRARPSRRHLGHQRHRGGRRWPPPAAATCWPASLARSWRRGVDARTALRLRGVPPWRDR